MESKQRQGKPADLTGADLTGVDLTGAELAHATLANTRLTGAVLEDVDLDDADLIDADCTDCDLQYAKLHGAILYGAKLVRAQLGFEANPAAGTGAGRTKWSPRRVTQDLRAALQAGKAIPEADKAGADLSRADLRGTDLTDAWLRNANLDATIYEPAVDPTINGIARAKHLDLATYIDDPEALVRLRKAFSDGGFVQAENKITYAVNRKQTALDPVGWRWFRRIAFDWTCQYGMNPGRPLKIIGLVWLAMAVFYFWCMHLRGRSGIRLEATREARGRERNWRFEVLLPGLTRPITPATTTRNPGHRLRREWRLARAAMFFSLTSAFNIGYQELNIGEWLKMLTKREYDLRAVGWARTVAGVQSLLSVYMLALWVLTYFGHPFE